MPKSEITRKMGKRWDEVSPLASPVSVVSYDRNHSSLRQDRMVTQANTIDIKYKPKLLYSRTHLLVDTASFTIPLLNTRRNQEKREIKQISLSHKLASLKITVNTASQQRDDNQVTYELIIDNPTLKTAQTK